MTAIQTVTGPVDHRALGHIAPHEHVLSSSAAQAIRLHRGPEEHLEALGIDIRDRDELVADITMRNHYWIRRHAMNVDNLTLDDEGAAVESLLQFRQAGGSTLVECTPIGLHRNPAGLRRISEQTGVNIIMGCGWYLHDFHPAELSTTAVEELTERILNDLTDGVDGTGIRSGIIGEIGTSWPIHPTERRVLQAAALAQDSSGVAIQVHPGRHPDAPAACLRVLDEAGADLTRVSISHLDRTILDYELLTHLAASACFLEFDMFGQESTYYPYGWFDVPNDGARVHLIERLLDRGLGDQILVSQDLGYRTLLPRWGGPGYAHILREVIPLMWRHGFAANDIDALTRRNPARWLSGREQG